MKRDSRGKKRSYFSLFKFFYSVYVVCIGNHITSRAIWDKSAQVIFLKTNQIELARRERSLLSRFLRYSKLLFCLFGFWLRKASQRGFIDGCNCSSYGLLQHSKREN